MSKPILIKLREWAEERDLHKIPFDKTGHTQNIIEELSEYYGAEKQLSREIAKSSTNYIETVCLVSTNKETSEYDVVDSLADQIVFCCTSLRQLGYDVEKVLNETYKEVNSRKGEYVESEKKWCKFTDDYHKSLWKKADFSKCKLAEKD